MKRISVLGHFDFGKESYNGQTVKTKIITRELDDIFGEENVLKIDTKGGKKTIFKSPFQVIKALKNSKNIIIFPAHNGVRVYAPLLVFFNKFYKKRLHYMVIGGWLPEFLKNKKHLTKALKKFDYIYVETNKMKDDLLKEGFDNIVIMPNCKKLNILKENELVYNETEPFKLCTFSRVSKQKGIEDAVKAVEYINDKYQRKVFTLDIYGAVEDNEKEWFNNLKKDFKEYVKYSGVVDFDKSVDILKNYYALLFPTFYEGEGFPGTLIDAFASGVPVIASDWRYNIEIVKEKVTGLLFKTHDLDDFTEKLNWIIFHNIEFNNMKKNCIIEAQKYEISIVIKNIVVNINKV